MADKLKSRTLTVKWSVQLPTVPNFILSTGDQKVDIAHVSDDGLRELGAAWTEALIENAQKRRKQNHETRGL